MAAASDALYVLGLAYYYGDSVPADRQRALAFFRDAAAAGHEQATVNLGHMLEQGDTTAPDATAAYAYYRQAAVRWKHAHSALRAAVLLYEGRVSSAVVSWEQAMRLAYEVRRRWRRGLFEAGAPLASSCAMRERPSVLADLRSKPRAAR